MDARLSRRRTPSRTRRDSLPALVLLSLLAPIPALAQGAGTDSVTLAWTAPGDDGNVGTAASYEVRMSSSPITAGNWSGASLVSGPPSPRPAGTRQSHVVRGLTRGTTYYFAIRAADESNNVAGISNVVRWDWILDSAPPSAPKGGKGKKKGQGVVTVEWSPNAEPDLAGYTVYRSLNGATGPFTALNSPTTLSTAYDDSGVPEGAIEVHYQLTASDQSGNESARSSVFRVDVIDAVAASPWTLQAAYPNPSRIGGPVSFPVDFPVAAGAAAELHIVNAGGQIIRRIVLNGLGGGPQTVTWDGGNQAGSQASPGVYTAWLVSGDTRRSTKLVRVP